MKNIMFLAVSLSVIISCDLSKKTTKTEKSETGSMPVMHMDSVVVTPKDAPVYQGSETRHIDIIHTRLDVRFDWTKARLSGKATITAKPYFYPQSVMNLDARGMEISEVSLMKGSSKQKLTYTYEKDVLSIQLDKPYTRTDSFRVYIEYVAKPDELEAGGSAAITSDKGLYFINPQNKEANKPQQVWTQGETQANSAWFPTVDRPNERMTNEIYMTVDKRFTTLSNGELAFQTDNGDGTRTDYWRMQLPHAPYLVMMAIGEYAVVKDKWRDKEVNYYVEKPYEKDAKAIFAHTPEMLEFFSNKLGVAYPWNKYSQVVVRDYVSGAMENTTASIFGEFVQKTERELIDGDNQEIVAHELFHQWFGDLVTCESWANLPLNESFATYGEYLWTEHKDGRDAADHHLHGNLQSYLGESGQKQVDMIRYYHTDREDMFDSHSYAKGGRILHMLRRYVGDDAFFASLKLYLETHKYQSVEIHDLRLAFEKVTGEDLNWFFNQWFLASGHPELEIKYNYDASLKKQTVTIAQKQKRKETPLYKLPMAIDIYSNGKKERHNITLTKAQQEFVFDAATKPDLVNVDAEKMLLTTKKDNKSVAEYTFQYTNAPLFMDRYEAVDFLKKNLSDSAAKQTLALALDDKYYSIRVQAINALVSVKALPKEKLMAMAQKDPHPRVRSAALEALTKLYSGDDLLPTLKAALNDKSYDVMSDALDGLAKVNPAEALKTAKTLENESVQSVLLVLAKIYSEHGDESHNAFYIKSEPRITGFGKIGFVTLYSAYLQKRKDETINEGLVVLEKIAKNAGGKWTKMYSQKAINDIGEMYKAREEKIQKKIADMKSTNAEAALVAKQEEELKQVQAQRQKVTDMVNSLKEEKK